jgi:hypothetical protein
MFWERFHEFFAHMFAALCVALPLMKRLHHDETKSIKETED